MVLRWLLCTIFVIYLCDTTNSSPVKKESPFRNDANTGNWTSGFFATWSSDPEVIDTLTEQPSTEDPDSNTEPPTSSSTVEEDDYLTWIKTEDEASFRRIHVRNIEKYRNTSVDPCENFYEYACGNWGNFHEDDGKSCRFTASSQVHQEIAKILRETITSDIRPEDSGYMIKTKEFFKSCMDTDEIQLRGIEPLIKFVTDLGSWPMLDDTWSSENFNWLNMLAKISLYEIDAIIEHAVIPQQLNGDGSKRFYLNIGCESFFPKDTFEKSVDAYKEFLRNNSHHLEPFGVTDEYIDDMGTRIAAFYGKLADIPCSYEKHETVDLKTLRESVPGIDWQEYFSTLLGRVMNPREIVVVRDMDYFVNLSHLVAQTSPKTVADLIFGNVMAQSAKHAMNFNADSRSDFCYKIVKMKMGDVLSNSFAKSYFNYNKQNEVLDIIEDLKAILRNAVANSDWLEKQSRLDAIGIIDKITASVGYTDLYTDEDLEKLYANIDIQPTKYFENAAQLQKKDIQSRLDLLGQSVDDTMETQIINSMMQKLSNKFTLIVPAGRLQAPFYHELAPRILNYGSIGQILVHEMLQPLLRKPESDESNESKKQWFVEEDQQEYDQKFMCYEDIEDSPLNVKRNSTNRIPYTVAGIEALKIALGAFKQWTENHPDLHDTMLQGYEPLILTPSQLFYLVYAQSQCAAQDKDESTLSDGFYRVNGAVANIEDFAETFQCPSGTKMNPVRKCSFIL